MLAYWSDPKSVYNSEEFREGLSQRAKDQWADPAIRAKLSKSQMGRRPKKTLAPGVDDMQSCRFCPERYHKKWIGSHERGCQKNPNNVSHTSYHSFENPEYFGAPKTVYQGEYFNACIIGDGTKLCCNCVKQKGLCRQHQHLGP